MRISKLCFFLAASCLMTACEPSPREAAEMFCRDLEAGGWRECGQLMTRELRREIECESKGWPRLLFAVSYYTDSRKCRLLKYETREGKAHTLISYSWRFTRAPMPGNVLLDLVWLPTNGCWRIENIFASSHFDMLLPVTTNSPPDIREKAHLSSCGLVYQKPYREAESWQSLGRALEGYVKTLYE